MEMVLSLSIETRNSIDFWLDQPINDIPKWQDALASYSIKKEKAIEEARKKGR
ncbi:hypothetical protein [Paenibacillus terrae]|uniref:hypothetical protein n=1 Tax=Paenibacillus terrae TaxID=159743 RepID=UPI001BAFF28C|nr:hypothetical protein [Paenibacillus terrae]